MIDTDKYEGHTPGPWTWRGETIDGDGEVNHTVCYMEHPHVNGEMNEVDARLIADTPLFLEEVKRLRSIADDLYACIVSGFDSAWDADISLSAIEEQMDWREEE